MVVGQILREKFTLRLDEPSRLLIMIGALGISLYPSVKRSRKTSPQADIEVALPEPDETLIVTYI